MSPTDLILVVLVGIGAFYAGYQLGRFKALSERGPAPQDVGPAQPLPGPDFDRRQADAGSSWQDAGASPGRAPPPRRSSKPPPAAAGLMGTGSTSKSDSD